MIAGRQTIAAGCLALGGILLLAGSIWACNVPVFRYALERWPPDPYQVYVFHRGPLAPEDQAALKPLLPDGKAGPADSNVDVLRVDVAGKMDEDVAKVWQSQSSPTAPWVVVRYPERLEVPGDAWSGRLTAEDAASLLDSPARREVARRIIGGEAAVFVLLESGTPAADDAAATLLGQKLARLPQVLELPKPDAGGWDDPVYDKQGAPPLKVAFSVLRVSRTDPAERMLVRMLLGVDPGLAKLAGPIAFPIYGRGRALTALAGANINKEAIEHVCEFFVAPCSCIVKEQNPGVDLLMTMNWEAALEGQASAIPAPAPPPVVGLGDFREGASPADERWSLLRNVLVAAIGGALIMAMAALVIWRRSSRRGAA